MGVGSIYREFQKRQSELTGATGKVIWNGKYKQTFS
jgi:hypothetical protein